MCGINAIIHFTDKVKATERLTQMNNSMSHRGPDAEGIFVNERIALGHRRLSIIDTSAAANQPMHTASHNASIVFNGEIYNYLELREELKHEYAFSTQSDTEVILALYTLRGIEGFNQLAGMFAFVLHDHNTTTTWVYRDRLGIKPIYYATHNEGIVVSSELRSVLASGLFEKKFNTAVLGEYIETQTIQAPNTCIEHIFFLDAGHALRITDSEFEKFRYYDLVKENHSCELTFQEAKQALRTSLTTSVEQHMRSDVRYGAFLSGGIDSSLMVALMAQHSSNPVETFQIAFQEDEFDESAYARIVAEKYGTDHHEIVLSENDFLKQIPNAVSALDFPSGDGPNTFVVSKATREAGLKVAISGLGGDELFAGYPVFKHMHAVANNKLLHFPHFIRKAASIGLSALLTDRAGQKKVELLAMKNTDSSHVFPLIRKVWDARKIARSAHYTPNLHQLNHIFKSAAPFLSKVSMAEMEAYMQHVLLRDSDQMSMAHALEIRVPFLDHRVVELAMQIPDHWKFPHTPKKFLTDTFDDLLPNEIVHRKKMGFTLPWNHWMKNELRTFCTEGLTILVNNHLLQSTILQEWENFLKGNTKLPFTAFWHLVVLGHWIQNNHIEVDL